MSFLVSSAPPISGAFVTRQYPGHGILGAEIPTSGDNGGSPALNDGIDPAKRYAWRVVTPPTGGTLTIYPDLSFDLVQGAAPDGSYPWTYRLLEDGQDAGTAVVSSTFGTTAVSLTATSISTQPVTLGTPSLAQTHVLSATGIATSAPVLGTPVLTQIAPGAIVALGITTSPVVLGTPALSQTHALSAGAIAAGPPTFTTPTLSQQHALMAQGIAAGAAVLGRPVLVEGGAHAAIDPGPARYRVSANLRNYRVTK